MIRMMAGTIEQPAWVPKFTKLGFEKTMIPPDVYEMLLWEYRRLKDKIFEEPSPIAVINCEKIIKDKKKKQSRIKYLGNTLLTELRWSSILIPIIGFCSTPPTNALGGCKILPCLFWYNQPQILRQLAIPSALINSQENPPQLSSLMLCSAINENG